MNKTRLSIHNNVIHPVEKIVRIFRGLKTVLLGAGLITKGFDYHIDKNILFACIFMLAIVITVKEFISHEVGRIRNELIKLRRGA